MPASLPAWTSELDARLCALVRRIVARDRPDEAWRALLVAVAPHVERWARHSGMLRRCGLANDDEARAVLVEVLERLARRGYENLALFAGRHPPDGAPDAAAATLPRPPGDALDVFARVCALDEDDGDDEAEGTPLRAWLITLTRFAVRDHLRKRLGPPARGEPGPSKRGVNTNADRLDDGAPAGAARPPVTDWLAMKAVVDDVAACTATFPPAMRTAFALWLADASFEDIAAQLGLEDAARARALVRAGQARLRARFGNVSSPRR